MKKYIGKILLGVSILCCMLIFILIGINSRNYTEGTYTNKITLEKFNKIEMGMSYEDVIEIIGEEGIVISESNIMNDEKYQTTIYCWYAVDGVANTNVIFQGGKVISKTQIGLD